MIKLCQQIINSYEVRLTKARVLYKQQQEKIDELSSPQLWRFSLKEGVKPDWKAEYKAVLERAEREKKAMKTKS